MTIETLGTLDATSGTERAEQQSPERSMISLGRGSGRPLQHKPERELRPCAMEAIEHHANPEIVEPDQAKRMQTSMSHLMPDASCLMPQAIEKIIAKDILRHTKAIWQKSDQFGFLPGRNTMGAIVKVIDDWKRALDKKKTIHAVFFDHSSISRRDPSETSQNKTENQTAHSINNNNNLRYPNPSINPVPALCIQSKKYQRSKNTQQQNA
jgi:hypothetical protein